MAGSREGGCIYIYIYNNSSRKGSVGERFDWERTRVIRYCPAEGKAACRYYIYAAATVCICVTANFPSGPARYHPRDKPRGKLGIRLECPCVYVWNIREYMVRGLGRGCMGRVIRGLLRGSVCVCVCVRQFRNCPETDNAILSVKNGNNFTNTKIKIIKK